MSTDADSKRIVETLLDEELLTLTDDERLQMSETLAAQITACQETVSNHDDEELLDELVSLIEEREEAKRLLELGDDTIVGEYLALGRTDLQRLSHTDRLRALTVFDALGESPPPEQGVPDGFVPVHGDRLPFLLETYRKAIVYIWLDDCDDCDVMKDVLVEVTPGLVDDIAMLAVYGPDAATLLHEEYSVPGGPATLFVLDGNVDARLYGAHDDSIVKKQVQTLHEL